MESNFGAAGSGWQTHEAIQDASNGARGDGGWRRGGPVPVVRVGVDRPEPAPRRGGGHPAAVEPRVRVRVRGDRQRRRVLRREGAAAQRRGRTPDLLGRAAAVAVMDPRAAAGRTAPGRPAHRCAGRCARRHARRGARAHRFGGRRLRRSPRRGVGQVSSRDDLGGLRPSRGQRPLRGPVGVHGSAAVPGGTGERHGTREPGDDWRRAVRRAARKDRRVRTRAGVVAHRGRGRPAARLPLGGR